MTDGSLAELANRKRLAVAKHEKDAGDDKETRRRENVV